MFMIFFAYDDKMYTPKLESILPQAKYLGVGKICGYNLFFHKQNGGDLSGTCNIRKANSNHAYVYGVLYEITPECIYNLEKQEHIGFGTQEVTIKVIPDTNCAHGLLQAKDVYAVTFIANQANVFEDLVPYDWYKEMVIMGAREHNLPESYIHHLEVLASREDPNSSRRMYNRNLLSKF